jgi:poly-beta-hydroxyalkanoate depolymerase
MRRARESTQDFCLPFQKKTHAVKEYNLLPSEVVLPDEHLINNGFVYLVDKVFTKSELPNGCTVKDWKDAGVHEVRRCSLFGHEGARLGDKVK